MTLAEEHKRALLVEHIIRDHAEAARAYEPNEKPDLQSLTFWHWTECHGFTIRPQLSEDQMNRWDIEHEFVPNPED